MVYPPRGCNWLADCFLGAEYSQPAFCWLGSARGRTRLLTRSYKCKSVFWCSQSFPRLPRTCCASQGDATVLRNDPSWPLLLTIHLEWCRLKSKSFWVASYLQKHSLGSTLSQNLSAIMILEALPTPKCLSSTFSSVENRMLICFNTSAAGSFVKQE